MATIILIGLAVVIELVLKPRVDCTPEGRTILWYGLPSNRQWTFLW